MSAQTDGARHRQGTLTRTPPSALQGTQEARSKTSTGVTAASPPARSRDRRERRTWPVAVVLTLLAIAVLAGLPLRNDTSGTAVRIGPASPLLPPTPVVVGETPPAAVEPGTYVAGDGGFGVSSDQTALEAVRLTTACGAAILPGIAIAADGSFGASATHAGGGLWVSGRFVRPDTARGTVRVRADGCDSGRVPFLARLRS